MKNTLLWLGIMILFLLVFLLGYVSLKLDVGVINIMPYREENMIIMGFSVLGMFKSVYELWQKNF